MSKWTAIYADKLTSPAEAMKGIKDGDRILISSASNTPTALIDALIDRAEEVRGVQIGGFIIRADMPRLMKPELQRHILIDNYYAAADERPWLRQGLMTHTPYTFHRLTRNATRNGKYNKLFLQAGPMDKQGFLNLGVFSNYLDALHKIDEIYVEVNEKQPRVLGQNHIHITQVTKLVENNHALFCAKPAVPSETDMAIAENIIHLVKDGSTVQLGIGGTPNALGELLLEKRHLGCHTEMVCDSYMKLFEEGAMDNSRKSFHRYQMCGFFALGSQELYDWMDDNEAIYFSPISYNNNPNVIGLNENLVSINGTLSVDISGQCASEAFGPFQFTATGGQVDFARGAWLSRGGKSIIITHSTATNRNGELFSKIVPQLAPGSIVTLPRTDVMYVATEFGVVNLAGLNLRERAQALISIAHPDFRRELAGYAEEVKYFVLPEHNPFYDGGGNAEI